MCLLTGVRVGVSSRLEPPCSVAESCFDVSCVFQLAFVFEQHASVECILQPHIALCLPIKLLLQYATIQQLHAYFVLKLARHGRCVCREEYSDVCDAKAGGGRYEASGNRCSSENECKTVHQTRMDVVVVRCTRGCDSTTSEIVYNIPN